MVTYGRRIEEGFKERGQFIMSKMHNEEVLMMKEDSNYTEALFEAIRHVNEYEQEFWYARELQVALE